MTRPAPTPEATAQAVAEQEAWLDGLLDLVAAIRTIFAGEDAFDIFACIYLMHLINDRRPVDEREPFVDSLALGEYAAMVLVERPARAPERADVLAEPWNALNAALPLLRELTANTSWTLSRFWQSPDSPVVALHERFLRRYMLVPINESDLQAKRWFRDLFDDAEIDAWMREILGFGVEDGERLVDALLTLCGERTMAAAEERLTVSDLPGVGAAMAFTAAELATQAGVDVATACRLCELVAAGFGQPARVWPALPTPMRHRPLVTDGSGRYLAPAPAMVRRGLRQSVAAALNPRVPAMGAGDARVYDLYNKRRGALLEDRGLASLAALLRPSEAHSNLHFLIRTREGDRCEGEIDGLLVLDRTAVVIQAKSAPTRIDAIVSDAPAFVEALDAIVTEAMRQHDDARAALLAPRNDVQFWTQAGKADTRVNVIPRLPATMEILPITVTLDDLAGCAPVAWRLRDAGLATDGELPWIVGTTPLDVMVDLCFLPAQMIHFLRRRAWVNIARNIDVLDEIDLFLEYLNNRLEVAFGPRERDGVPVVWLPPERFHALDDWVMRSEDSSRPRDRSLRQKLHRGVRSVLERLDRDRGPRWLEASLAILDAPLAIEQRIGSAFAKVGAGRARETLMAYNKLEGGRELFAVVEERAGRRLDSEATRTAMLERAREHECDSVTALVLPAAAPIRVVCASDPVA